MMEMIKLTERVPSCRRILSSFTVKSTPTTRHLSNLNQERGCLQQSIAMAQENLDDEWERSEESLKKLQIGAPPPSVQQSSNSSGQIYEEAPKEDDFIDPALSDTLQNPQERMNLLKFENKILHFVKSK